MQKPNCKVSLNTMQPDLFTRSSTQKHQAEKQLGSSGGNQDLEKATANTFSDSKVVRDWLIASGFDV